MEIKFKAYIKSLGWVVDVERINFDCKTIEVDLSAGQGDTTEYDFDEVELLQYTGLKDKEGKEICKGDILIQNNNKADLVQVCFGEFNVRSLETERVIDKIVGWYLKVVQTDAISKVAPFCYDTPLNNYWIERLSTKVIGNIYENPELWEGVKHE